MGAPAPYHHYVNYLSADDIYVFSIDERLIDFTSFFMMYNRFLKEFMKILIDGIRDKFCICATDNIGTNIFS